VAAGRARAAAAHWLAGLAGRLAGARRPSQALAVRRLHSGRWCVFCSILAGTKAAIYDCLFTLAFMPSWTSVRTYLFNYTDVLPMYKATHPNTPHLCIPTKEVVTKDTHWNVFDSYTPLYDCR